MEELMITTSEKTYAIGSIREKMTMAKSTDFHGNVNNVHFQDPLRSSKAFHANKILLTKTIEKEDH